MNKQDFLSAVAVLQQIGKWQNTVSQERFYRVAEAKFGISERDADLLYNLFSTARKHFAYVNTEYDKKNMSANLQLALTIAEEAYRIYHNNGSVPCIPISQYGKDLRRYFVAETQEQGEVKRYAVDVNLHEKASIVLFAELLQRDCIEIKGVTHNLGELKRKERGEEVRTCYYEGDIAFVFGDPSDHFFDCWYRRKDAGVFLATDNGWRKLLYTTGRGYVNKKYEIEYDGDTNYNEHMIQGIADAKDWRIVGNIHDNMDVLVDKEED